MSFRFLAFTSGEAAKTRERSKDRKGLSFIVGKNRSAEDDSCLRLINPDVFICLTEDSFIDVFIVIEKRNFGERGIRTLDTLKKRYNGLANRRFQPLSHLSKKQCSKGCQSIATWCRFEY